MHADARWSWKKIAAVLGRLQATTCPWIVGLDAQQEPSELLRWAGPLLSKVGAKIIRTKQPTFFPGAGGGKKYDYFMMLETLSSSVKKVGTMPEFRCKSADNDYTISAGPHRLVWASFHSKAVERLRWVIRAPRKFSKEKPCGCARAPCAPRKLEDKQLSAMMEGTQEEREEAVGRAWTKIVRCVEEELCGIFDFIHDGKLDRRGCGRGQGAGWFNDQCFRREPRENQAN